MKTKCKSFISPKNHSFGTACMVAVTVLFGVLASSAQTGDYLYSGSEVIVTLNPGTYDITAYGAQGGSSTTLKENSTTNSGGLGAEMEGQFSFASVTTLTLLVGGGGGNSGDDGNGGGGGCNNGGNPDAGRDGGGGGGSIIDSSAIADLTEISGVASPDDSPNGEIIITAVQVLPPSAPLLFINRLGNTVAVCWTNEPGWSLQQNTNLASPTGWTPSSGITTSNGTNYLNVVNPAGSLFFRLSN